ncbi:CLUMA_CG019835, isoform A [Clunio marinus]|uniref:CLUMA_CG019835, isoform A n=1 Tax=Clunio marinus TaxID=568069 RepID=A0A1J1J3L8_9DIPT|nr:CLUMA_CG019835, isoform A [Clunio marinus]
MEHGAAFALPLESVILTLSSSFYFWYYAVTIELAELHELVVRFIPKQEIFMPEMVNEKLPPRTFLENLMADRRDVKEFPKNLISFPKTPTPTVMMNKDRISSVLKMFIKKS